MVAYQIDLYHEWASDKLINSKQGKNFNQDFLHETIGNSIETERRKREHMIWTERKNNKGTVKCGKIVGRAYAPEFKLSRRGKSFQNNKPSFLSRKEERR